MNGTGNDTSLPSDTSPVEITKKTIRQNVWKKVKKSNSASRYGHFIYNRIPWFSGSDDPAVKLKELDTFNSSKNILVGYDRAQESVKLACLEAGKILYVQYPKLQKYLMTCLKLDEGANEEVFHQALKLKGLEEYGKTLGMEDNIEIDMVVIGSIAVSRNGIRIGKGGGYTDMYLAVLSHLKIIKPETIIVTTVHDCQILESIPSNIVSAYDFPVDIIVTPTQIIYVDAERPPEIIWNLISSRKLQAHPMLSKIRDAQIEQGKECALKVEDSDVEHEGVNGGTKRFYYRNRWSNRRWQGPRYRKQVNGVHSESENYETGDGEPANANNRQNKGRRVYLYRRRRPISNNGGKNSYRNKAWYILRSSRAVTTPRIPYYRIPGFKGVIEATQHFKNLEVFQNAKTVLVSTDKLHEGIRIACLEEGKVLYVLNPRPEKEVLIRVDVPEQENKPEMRNIVNRLGLEEYGVKLEPDESVKIDLWVVGSVAISKDGHHIGKGNGSIDLQYGFLVEKKVITPETVIVTTVHSCQVFDTFPEELFGEHDVPVNIIVTPTDVFEIKNDRKPTTGILWNLLTESLLKQYPYLAEFRTKEIEAGKSCELKEIPNRRKTKSNENSGDSEQNEQTEGESGSFNRKKRVGPKTWRRGRRNIKETAENEESGNISPDTTSRPRRRFPYRQSRSPIDFSIKVTSINRATRVRDLKVALNERNVKPTLITWAGYKGFCYLHFAKTPVANVDVETEVTSESILNALADLTLQPTPDEDANAPPPPNKVLVELAKPKPFTRIETADETTV